MNEYQISACLTKKIKILENINRNSILQRRFVHRLDFRGLRRLIRERAKLLDDLVAINAELDSYPNWQQAGDYQIVLAGIAQSQREILSLSDQVLQEAIFERSKIAATLNNAKLMRQAKNHYVKQWTMVGMRSRLNVKG